MWRRAAAPISLRRLPPWPMTMPLWESRSSTIDASMRTSPGPVETCPSAASSSASPGSSPRALSSNDHLVFTRPWLDGIVALASVVEASGDLTLATTIALPVVRGPAALAKAGAFFTLSAGLKKAPSRGLFCGVLSAFSAAESRPSGEVKECLTAATEALNRYFALFTERFPTSSSARRWVDAASAFLADIKQTFGDLKE